MSARGLRRKIKRIAIAKEKRYGLKRLSKEENKRLKLRTEERIEIARAKENYWRKYRDRKVNDMKEEEKEAWIHVDNGILMFEEDGAWIKEERRMSKEKVANVEKRKVGKGAEGRRKGVEGEIEDSTNDRMSVAKGGGGMEELRLEVSRRIVRKGVLESGIYKISFKTGLKSVRKH